MNSKIGRNDPCPCGSGKKYKNCHFGKDEEKKPTYTASGKRKFKAVVLDSTGMKGGSLFNASNHSEQAPTSSQKLEELKLKLTEKDYRKQDKNLGSEDKE